MTQIKIHTIDNPGWGVDIFSSRIKSAIRTVTFSQELSDDDWLIHTQLKSKIAEVQSLCTIDLS